ncbi:hypothetical protein Ancab_037097 [Ancistrocladus abbreviatus]
MCAVTNMRKGLSIPQEEGPLNCSCMSNHSRSHGIPIEHLGNQVGRSNWEESIRHGGGYSQEMPNYNAAIPNFNRIHQLNAIASFRSASSAYRNGAVNHTAEVYTQASTSDEGCWNSSWAQILALMEAPSSDSENEIANRIINSTNKYFIPNSPSQDGNNQMWPVMNTPSVVSENGIPNSVNAVDKHVMLNSCPQDDGCSMQSNIASSVFLNQIQNTYTASKQRICNSLPQTLEDGCPVPFKPQYDLNSSPRTEADTASSITNSSQFAPATPEQAQKFDNCRSSVTNNASVDQDLGKDKVKSKDLVASAETGAVDNHDSELLQNVVDTSSAAICTPSKERNDSGKGENQEFDLNKTPLQKTPKRKKHRPKVVRESKPKRNRKPMNTHNRHSEGEKLVKRKYVRKNAPRTANTPEADAAKETRDSSCKPASISCRKVLNFEMEQKTRDETWAKPVNQQETHHQIVGYNFVNVNSQETGLGNGCCNNSVNSVQQTGQWDNVVTRNKEAGIMCNLKQTIDQAQTGKKYFSNGTNPITQLMLRDLQMENQYTSACNTTSGATDQCQSGKYCSTKVHQQNQGGQVPSFFGERTAQEIPKRTADSNPQKQPQKVSDPSQGKGSKREFFKTTENGHPNSLHPNIPSLLCQEIFQLNEHTVGSLDKMHSGPPKKMRVENKCHTTTSSMQNCRTIAEESSRQDQNSNILFAVNQFEKGNGGSFKPPSINTSKKQNSGLNHMTDEQFPHFAFSMRNIQKQHMQPVIYPQPEKMVEKRANFSATKDMISSLTARADSRVQHSAPSKKSPTHAHRQGAETSSYNSQTIPSARKQNDAHAIPKSAAQRTGSHDKQKNLITINDIIYQLQKLNLNAINSEMGKAEQNAIVPYKGDGIIVPYEEFDPIKRRKARPKVDLDPETNRIWKLLMGKEASVDDKEMDEDKAKWWEEERKVFRGRTDSFIARMHLVQGDRRFSPWKGSVVDSVIGVFLTQNVTDHLSSSAFMSLAARFPVQSTSKNIKSQNDMPGIFVEEPEVFVLGTGNNTRCHDKSPSSTVYERVHYESPGHRSNFSLPNGIPRFIEGNTWGMEDAISSQDSTQSSASQAARGVQSFSGSNSRTNCPTNSHKMMNTCSSTSLILHEMENTTGRFSGFPTHVPGSSSFAQLPGKHVKFNSAGNGMYMLSSGNKHIRSASVTYPFNLNGPQKQVPVVHSANSQFPVTADSELFEVQGASMFRNDNITFLPSSASGIMRGQNVGITGRVSGHVVQNKTALQQNGRMWPIKTSTSVLYPFHNKHLTEQRNSVRAEFCAGQYQNSDLNYQHGETMSFQLKTISGREPHNTPINGMQSVPRVNNLPGAKPDTEKSIPVAQKEVAAENKTAESIPKEHLSSPGESYGRLKTTAHAAKGEKMSEKKMAFDWDSLRKQVLSSGNRRERTKNSMDSIDFEAVRVADVNEISEAIKDRGMNNMLAERMKNFLIRLVKDHGSIDLEWLRDAPPDKAKEYLLSIRGLGLKSVECIRLLTLHQHAFPVDTNVGRIAVRLGWVPLQPLPESLQLHLLELYPVLESIQKYLWPRLCKLDQRTLYELHYQLITFGKVFCTKSKPNCNACPMRGECRHFASAFASARFALPGPEEKGMVASAAPVQSTRKPIINVNPIRLHPLEDAPPGEFTSASRSCEPIVEEPTTPEMESTETSETDIEDVFYEDPDEIPTIKLSAEEFTSLQNYIQENLEFAGSDVSKALVALNPGAASIPTPKLKNVSRLRTEHQVYELPDSHPLLKELDKREPDDPSLYLLAIWSPGETEDSIQPPEGPCGSWESGILCNEKTCFSCNSKRESASQIVRGTILIPCRTAMRGSFPLNGTYFQVNEVFADHGSSMHPIDVPRQCIWNLPRRTVYFGTSVSTIFKGMSTEDIQQCFWRGFVCVRGFDRKTRAPRPLIARLHFPASKLAKGKKDSKR